MTYQRRSAAPAAYEPIPFSVAHAWTAVSAAIRAVNIAQARGQTPTAAQLADVECARNGLDAAWRTELRKGAQS